MRLYYTPGSPYARTARIVIFEKALRERVTTTLARTREAGSPYYEINPSGRVPCLVLDDGRRMEGAALICAYLDQLDGRPELITLAGADAWEARTLEASAQSTLEGLAVWARELRRPANERSPGVIAHEAARADRLLAEWESCLDNPLLAGPLNLLQIVLACALGLEGRTLGAAWHADRPRLWRWYQAIARRPSFVATRPPGWTAPNLDEPAHGTAPDR